MYLNLIAIISTIPIISSAFGYFNPNKKRDTNIAYVTYHMYDESTPLTTLACSDGENGLITKYGIYDLNPIFPGVMAADFISWNSQQCGECIQLTNGNNQIYSRVVDGCGKITSQQTHFDLDPVSFNVLFGNTGILDGHGYVEWNIVDSSLCKAFTSTESSRISNVIIGSVTSNLIIKETNSVTHVTHVTPETIQDTIPDNTKTSPCTVGHMKCNSITGGYDTCIYESVSREGIYSTGWITRPCAPGTLCKDTENYIICF